MDKSFDISWADLLRIWLATIIVDIALHVMPRHPRTKAFFAGVEKLLADIADQIREDTDAHR